MNKGEQTKQFIIEQAAPIFNKKGIEGTSYADILKVTKLSKGTHFVHFKDKNDLALQVADYCLVKVGKALSDFVQSFPTGKERLFAYIDFFSSPKNLPIEGGCPMLNFGVEVDEDQKDLRLKVKKTMKSGCAIIADAIKLGIENNEFNPSWDAEEFAVIMFSMLEGAQLFEKATGSNTNLKIVAKSLRKMIEEKSI